MCTPDKSSGGAWMEGELLEHGNASSLSSVPSMFLKRGKLCSDLKQTSWLYMSLILVWPRNTVIHRLISIFHTVLNSGNSKESGAALILFEYIRPFLGDHAKLHMLLGFWNNGNRYCTVFMSLHFFDFQHASNLHLTILFFSDFTMISSDIDLVCVSKHTNNLLIGIGTCEEYHLLREFFDNSILCFW